LKNGGGKPEGSKRLYNRKTRRKTGTRGGTSNCVQKKGSVRRSREKKYFGESHPHGQAWGEKEGTATLGTCERKIWRRWGKNGRCRPHSRESKQSGEKRGQKGGANSHRQRHLQKNATSFFKKENEPRPHRVGLLGGWGNSLDTSLWPLRRPGKELKASPLSPKGQEGEKKM